MDEFDIIEPLSCRERLIKGMTEYKIAVIYARYSCDRQNEQSIDGQLRVCKEFAERNGIKIVAVYVDKAMSGTNDNREEFQKMLKDSDRKEWDAVLVYKLDRFSRNKYEMAIHRKHLKDNGVKIISAMENIPDSPEGILLESLLEGMNQYYSEELSQKTKRGLNESRLKGNFCGGVINYGWSLVPVYSEQNGKNVQIAKKVIINEEEAPIVKEIFTEYINGKKPIDIARDLTNRGIFIRGRCFQAYTIYNILRQEKYTGIYRLYNNSYDKIYPQIISTEIYNTAKTKIDANKFGKHIKHDISYMLKGKVFCGYCGKRMISYAGTSKSGNINRYYRCSKTASCQRRPVKKEILETAITTAFKQMLSTKNNFNLLVNKILEIYNGSLYDTSALRLAEKELSRVGNSLSNLIAAVENGFYSETTNVRLKELEVRKTELKKIIAVEKDKEIKPLEKEQVANFITHALNQPSQSMIDLLVRKVIVKDDVIDVYLKYTKNLPPDEKTKNGTSKFNIHPERNLSERGFLFAEFPYSYKAAIIGRKPIGVDFKYGETLSVNIRLFI